MGLASAAGLAMGGLGLGLKGIAENKARKLAANQTAEVLRQQMLQSAQQAQQMQTFQTEQQQAQQAAAERAKQEMDRKKNQADSMMTPFGTTQLTNPATIATSPLGDTSQAFLGRKLLTGS